MLNNTFLCYCCLIYCRTWLSVLCLRFPWWCSGHVVTCIFAFNVLFPTFKKCFLSVFVGPKCCNADLPLDHRFLLDLEYLCLPFVPECRTLKKLTNVKKLKWLRKYLLVWNIMNVRAKVYIKNKNKQTGSNHSIPNAVYKIITEWTVLEAKLWLSLQHHHHHTESKVK